MIIFEYLEELILYQLGAYTGFDLKTKMPWAQVAGGGACLLLAHVTNVPDSMLAYGVTLGVVFFSLEEEWKERFWQMGALIVLISGMEIIFPVFGRLFLPEIYGEWQYIFLESGIKILVLIIIGYLRRFILEEKKEFFRNLLPIIFFMCIGIFFAAIFIWEYLSVHLSVRDGGFFREVVKGYLLVTGWMLAMVLIYIWHQNKKLNLARRRELLLYQAQKEYYEVLLKREEDTKRFRHDLKNHLVCLQELMDEEKWDEAGRYLRRLEEGTKHAFGKKYDLGNAVLEALTSYLLADLDQGTTVRVTDHMKEEILTDSVGLCTIYSNLLKNAVEELARCRADERKILFIDFWSDEEWIKIEIKNSLSVPTKDLTKTSKEDKKNHGFGIQNVKEKVIQLHGKVSFSQKNGEFSAEVILPNRETV